MTYCILRDDPLVHIPLLHETSSTTTQIDYKLRIHYIGLGLSPLYNRRTVLMMILDQYIVCNTMAHRHHTLENERIKS
jgi:hypothetical protein